MATPLERRDSVLKTIRDTVPVLNMSNLLGLSEEVSNEEIEPERDNLNLQLKNGANWFYWIAALSLINSLIYAFGSDVAFITGLGFTQLIDGFTDVVVENGAPSAFKAVAIIVNLTIVVSFGLFGYYANKGFALAFIIGIAIYVIDTFLLFFLGLYLSAGFHVFALFFIVRGYLACCKLRSSS